MEYESILNSSDVLILERAIKYYATKYYTTGAEITDTQFDDLLDRLRSLDPNSSVLEATGWGYDPTEVTGDKLCHSVPMNSINCKPRSFNAIPARFKCDSGLTRITPKFDGISMALYYTDGRLTKAITRGNGKVGLDATHKMQQVTGVPIMLPYEFTGVIRGECIITNEDWMKFKELVPEASNQRNSAAGILNADNSPYISYITFMAYKVLACSTEFRCLLPELGFLKIPTNWVAEISKYLCESEFKNLYNKYCQTYPCDGIVLTRQGVRDDSGRISYDEIAYKFDNEVAITTVTGISWNLTRTHRMVPTVLINPVEISGATVSRVTGNNASFIQDHRIGVGATIKIIRSGEVIPKITEVLIPREPNLPTECPICHEPLELHGTDLVCTNESCDGSLYNRVHHWISTLAKIDGLGGSLISKFIEDNDISSIDDLYSRELLKYPGTSVANKLIDQMLISLKSPVDPREALCALNIPRLGWTSAEKIVDADLYSAFKMLQDDWYDSDKIKSLVGPATYASIIKNRSLIKNLNHIEIIQSDTSTKESTSSESKGEVVITGSLSIKRSEFEKIIKDNGYTPSGSIKKTTKYLITNNPDGSSSKNKKANELGIPKITEDEFMNLIKRGE